jgi:hypothetical protein
MTTVKVLFHDGCFDGAASAAVFTRFYRERVDDKATFTYQGLAHKRNDPLDERLFDGEQNAIVDFRYSVSGRLTWWFDHHVSSFPNPGEEAHFRADRSGRKFHDPEARAAPSSCAASPASGSASTTARSPSWSSGRRSSTERCSPAPARRCAWRSRRSS